MDIGEAMSLYWYDEIVGRGEPQAVVARMARAGGFASGKAGGSVNKEARGG